jgi:transposase
LGCKVDSKSSLSQLREIVSKHKAFETQTKLEILAKRYNVQIIFCPKFHCELNPIEGLWCSQKKFVRQRTDQNYDTMVRLIYESRGYFIEKKTYIKLWRRFRRCINAYKKGVSYGEILTTYFSGKSKEKIQAHRKIYNQNLEDFK